MYPVGGGVMVAAQLWYRPGCDWEVLGCWKLFTSGDQLHQSDAVIFMRSLVFVRAWSKHRYCLVVQCMVTWRGLSGTQSLRIRVGFASQVAEVAGCVGALLGLSW